MKRSLLRSAWGHRITRVGAAITAVVGFIAVAGPLFAPHAPEDFVARPFTGPIPGSPLGSDYIGHDVLSALLRGGISILWMACAAAAIGVAVGAALGMIAAASGKFVNEIIMRLLDVAYAFPFVVLILIFMSTFGANHWLIVGLTAFAFLPGIARMTRGVASEALSREYVQAAQVIGVRKARILLKDVLPNISTPLLVEFSQRLTWSVAVIATISFLGYGPQPPATDWGLMINQNRAGLAIQPWAVLGAVALIGLFAIGTSLFAEGMARAIAGVDRKVAVG
ncbi:MAG: ABC transporter permease [Ilumatobacteraceae bacterium]